MPHRGCQEKTDGRPAGAGAHCAPLRTCGQSIAVRVSAPTPPSAAWAIRPPFPVPVGGALTPQGVSAPAFATNAICRKANPVGPRRRSRVQSTHLGMRANSPRYMRRRRQVGASHRAGSPGGRLFASQTGRALLVPPHRPRRGVLTPQEVSAPAFDTNAICRVGGGAHDAPNVPPPQPGPNNALGWIVC